MTSLSYQVLYPKVDITRQCWKVYFLSLNPMDYYDVTMRHHREAYFVSIDPLDYRNVPLKSSKGVYCLRIYSPDKCFVISEATKE